MNQTAAAVGNTTSALLADSNSAITTVHLALMALLAMLAVVGIVYGARLKHRRVVAEREVEDHAREAGVVPDDAGADDAEVAPPAAAPAPAPIAAAPLADLPSAINAPEALADQPVAATPLPADGGGEAPSPAAEPASAADGPVTQLKGLGPKVAARLGELGITTVGQIAALNEDGATALDARLGAFSGRMHRDRWVEQARFLAAGDRAGFEAVFGRL